MRQAAIPAAVGCVCEVEAGLALHRQPAVSTEITWFPPCEQLLAGPLVCCTVATLSSLASLCVALGVLGWLAARAA